MNRPFISYFTLSLLLLTFLCGAGAVHSATVEQQDTVWYRLHLGMGIGDFAVAPAKMREFIDKEITVAFPNGLTVSEARGQWRSPEHGLIREKTIVVDLQCQDTEENRQAIERIATTYVERFKAAQASLFVKRIAPISTVLYYN